jgi:hypothetical protein
MVRQQFTPAGQLAVIVIFAIVLRFDFQLDDVLAVRLKQRVDAERRVPPRMPDSWRAAVGHPAAPLAPEHDPIDNPQYDPENRKEGQQAHFYLSI